MKILDVRAVQPNLKPLPGIRNIIAIGSGKGGVGKSTTTLNLALALHQLGYRVGVLDADIYGPNQPHMLGVSGKPETDEQKRLIPPVQFGIPSMSMGYLVAPDTPMVWRGPMISSAMQQLLEQTAWPELDILLIDLPPGTGDVQLTMAKRIPVSGALIVTTPQDVALLDARKAQAMFEKVNVVTLGLIENMSVYVCPNCGEQAHLFGEGGGQRMAEKLDLPLLGQLPLTLAIREAADAGKPLVAAQPDSKEASLYRDIATAFLGVLAKRPKSYQHKMPPVVVEP